MSGRGYNGVVASVDPIKKATHTIAELAKTAQMDLFNRLKVALPNSQ